MYLHLGQHTTVNTRDIVGLFDLDTTTLSKRTRDFLARAEKEGRVVNTTSELPKSFAVSSESGGRVYICQLTAQTLKKRVDGLNGEYRKFKKNTNK